MTSKVPNILLLAICLCFFSVVQVTGQPQEKVGPESVEVSFSPAINVLTVMNNRKQDLKNYVVAFTLSKKEFADLNPKDHSLKLVEFGYGNSKGAVFPAQFGKPWLTDLANSKGTSSLKDDVRVTAVVDQVDAKIGRSFQLVAQKEKPAGEFPFRFRGDQQTRTLTFQGHPILKLMGLRYQKEPKDQRNQTYKVFHHAGIPGVDGFLTKGPGGLFSHHRGIFYGFNRIRFQQNGKKYNVDTWHAGGAYQELKSVELEEVGEVFARQVVKIHWMNEKVDPAKVFAVETRQICCYQQGDHWVFDISSSLESRVGEIDLKGDPQHAGFQFRASQEVAESTKQHTYYLRPDGIDKPGSFRNWPKQKKHINLPYHGMHFKLKGHDLAVLRLDQSSNPRPSRFSERDYGRFGCYFEHLLKPDSPLKIHYRLLVKKGKYSVKDAASWHAQFQSSKAAVEKKKIERKQQSSGNWNSVGWDVQIEEDQGKTVFSAGQAGDWDAAIRERGWISKDADRWTLYYTGYDGTRKGIKRLGVATSSDGWSWKRSKGPLFENHWVEDMCVAQAAGEKWMFAEGRGDLAHRLVTIDGQWKIDGPLDIRNPDQSPISKGPRGTPAVIHYNDHWYLFYERRDQGIWLAKSKDGKVWTGVKEKPVIDKGDFPWESQMIALNQVIKVEGGFLALLHGTGSPTKPRKWCCYCAFSTDLIHWKKRPEPLTDPANNRSSGILVRDGVHRWAFFTMHGKVERFPVQVKKN